MGAPLIAELAALVGAHHVLTGERLLARDVGTDPGHNTGLALVRPGSTAEMGQVVSLLAARGVAMVAQGGRTGLAGGGRGTADAVILSTERLNHVSEVDVLGANIRAGAGATLAAVQQAAAAHGFSPGIDLGARDSATIGGMIATNAGGVEAFRHGTMRHRIRGIEAVLANGAIIDCMTSVTKANEGYDLKQLLAGSEGTLGIITAAVLALTPVVPNRVTALVATRSHEAALQCFSDVRRHAHFTLCAAEMMSGAYFQLHASKTLGFLAQYPVLVIFEAGGAADGEVRDSFQNALAAALDRGEISECVIAGSERERAEMWLLREDSWVTERHYPGGHWFDVSVPPACIDTCVARLMADIHKVFPEMHVYLVGHLADGNLHVTVSSQPAAPDAYDRLAAIVYAGVADMGGSFSAEHGIGLEKRASLAKLAPARLQALRAIKTALDPKGLFNPGKML